MLTKTNACRIRIVGVALEGRDGAPVVVFESQGTGELLPLPIDPFGAETLIRGYLGENDEAAVAWLADALGKSAPSAGRIVSGDDAYWVRFPFRLSRRPKVRRLPLGEGLSLCRRLEIPLYAAESLFEASRDDLAWMAGSGSFLGDFLYLSPPQYAPGIPME